MCITRQTNGLAMEKEKDVPQKRHAKEPREMCGYYSDQQKSRRGTVIYEDRCGNQYKFTSIMDCMSQTNWPDAKLIKTFKEGELTFVRTADQTHGPYVYDEDDEYWFTPRIQYYEETPPSAMWRANPSK